MSEPSIYWFFTDKARNFEFSISGEIHYFHPSGVVTCFQPPRDRADGCEVGVVYRSPSGRLFRAWRSMREIEFERTDSESWLMMYNHLVCEETYRAHRIN